MFTVCPKCALTLVVTAADLKVAQGYVRCGRCSNVFNAITALSDERQGAAGLEGYGELEPPPAEKTPTAENLEFDPVATNVSDVFVEPGIGDDEETGTFEAIVLETGEPDSTSPEEEAAAPDPDKELQHELQSLAKRIEAKSHEAAALPPITPPKAGTREENILPLEPGLSRHEEGVDGTSRRAWLWGLGITALVLTLVAQAIHHYRRELAANPPLNGPLAAIYNAFGASLVPRWDLAAYEVHQLGAATSPANADQLIVRASLKNAGRRAQPLPLLRITVQDRFGNRIAARDVAPRSYAPRSMGARALLAAGQRVDVEMSFLDPGREAVGFEIDACLPAPGGGVDCANQAGAR